MAFHTSKIATNTETKTTFSCQKTPKVPWRFSNPVLRCFCLISFDKKKKQKHQNLVYENLLINEEACVIQSFDIRVFYMFSQNQWGQGHKRNENPIQLCPTFQLLCCHVSIKPTEKERFLFKLTRLLVLKYWLATLHKFIFWFTYFFLSWLGNNPDPQLRSLRCN